MRIPSNQTAPKRGGRANWLVLAGVGIAAGTAGAFISLTLAGPHTAGIGLWLRDFAKTPGAAALAALIAACIALSGISRQVSVSRANLELERRREQDRSWWQSFEWAVSRGVPLDAAHRALREDVSINTFTALQASALTDVQRSACSGMLDILSTERPTSDEDTSSNLPLDSESSESEAYVIQGAKTYEALATYVKASAGTAAASAGARARLYELQVLSVMEGFAGPGVSFLDPKWVKLGPNSNRRYRPDAVMVLEGQYVNIESKYRDSAVSVSNWTGLQRSIEAIRTRGIDTPVLFVSPQTFEIPDQVRKEWAFEIARWQAPEDNESVRSALVRAAKLDPFRPLGPI